MKQIYRIRERGVIAGVCAGAAVSIGIDPLVVRLAFVVATVLGLFIGVPVYVALWILLPVAPAGASDGDVDGHEKATVEGPWEVVDVVEKERMYEVLGQDTQVIDTSKSRAKAIRTIKLEKQWTMSYRLETEKASRSDSSRTVTIGDLLRMMKVAEQNLVHRYAIVGEERRTFTDQIVIEVPPRTGAQLVITWKQVWQHGVVKLRNPSRVEIEVPFRVAAGLTFDQQVIDRADVGA